MNRSNFERSSGSKPKPVGIVKLKSLDLNIF